jgi:hypothetical protein
MAGMWTWWTTLAVGAVLAPLAVSSQDPEGQAPEPSPTAPAAAEGDGRGVYVRTRGRKRYVFVPWESEESLNKVFESMKGVGGEVHFTAGTYTLEQGFVVTDVPDLTVSGTPAVTLEFANEPEPARATTAPIEAGASSIFVDHAEGLRPGWKYQLYAANGRGDRRLEFEVAGVEGSEVRLAEPAHYMPHVTEIPAGCRVLEEVNVFNVHSSPRLTIQNLVLDGHGRGDVRGHTIYCGILNVGDYREGRRPSTFGFTVRGCTFRGLDGRGIAFYGVGDGLIEGNAFHDIRAQAIEIDHFSSGTIRNNFVERAETGVTLNDCFDSLVEGNVLRDCQFGVYFMKVLDYGWVNTGNTIRDNQIGPGCDQGIAFRDAMEGNFLRNNRFLGIERESQVVRASE